MNVSTKLENMKQWLASDGLIFTNYMVPCAAKVVKNTWEGLESWFIGNGVLVFYLLVRINQQTHVGLVHWYWCRGVFTV